MASKDDLTVWLYEALKAQKGHATIVEVCKQIWQKHEDDLRKSGDLFFTWAVRRSVGCERTAALWLNERSRAFPTRDLGTGVKSAPWRRLWISRLSQRQFIYSWPSAPVNRRSGRYSYRHQEHQHQ